VSYTNLNKALGQLKDVTISNIKDQKSEICVTTFDTVDLDRIDLTIALIQNLV